MCVCVCVSVCVCVIMDYLIYNCFVYLFTVYIYLYILLLPLPENKKGWKLAALSIKQIHQKNLGGHLSIQIFSFTVRALESKKLRTTALKKIKKHIMLKISHRATNHKIDLNNRTKGINHIHQHTCYIYIYIYIYIIYK